MRDLFDEIHPAPLEDNKGALSNGMLGALPFADYEMDRMPYSTRFWATIAKHRQQAYEEGFTEAQDKYKTAALNVEDKAKAGELENIHSVIQALSFRVADDLDSVHPNDLQVTADRWEGLTKLERDTYRDLIDMIEEKVREGIMDYIERKELEE